MNLFTSTHPVKQETPTNQANSALDHSWSRAGSFVESILAGALVGYLLDLWWGTEPWMVIVGIVLGSYTGFMRIWAMLKEQDGVEGER